MYCAMFLVLSSPNKYITKHANKDEGASGNVDLYICCFYVSVPNLHKPLPLPTGNAPEERIGCIKRGKDLRDGFIYKTAFLSCDSIHLASSKFASVMVLLVVSNRTKVEKEKKQSSKETGLTKNDYVAPAEVGRF
jgi:hypothetical protein